MPRKKLYRSENLPYHVTARCINKEWFAIPIKDVWDIFTIYLYFVSAAFKINIHSFVLMNNHFHMLVTTPEANLDQAMGYLLREVSKRIGERSCRINQIFGGPYHWSLITNSVHYQHAYKYVYRNPVHAGICERVEDYPYSSLSGLIGRQHLGIPVIDNQNLIQDTGRTLKWLNTEYSPENRELIRLALRRQEFQFPREESNATINYLDSHMV